MEYVDTEERHKQQKTSKGVEDLDKDITRFILLKSREEEEVRRA